MEKIESATKFGTPSEREIAMTRTFDAPRELVFEAVTRPEHVARWWGLRGSAMAVCESDLRVGGGYRFVTREPDGREVGFRGVYQEVVRPERLVYTEIFEDQPDGVSITTTNLADVDGKTRLTSTTLFESQEIRDMVVETGMEVGAAESMDRLAELLAALA